MPTVAERENREDAVALRQFVETRGWQQIRQRLEGMAADELRAITTAQTLQTDELVQVQVRHLARYTLLLEVLDMPRRLEAQASGT